MGWAEPDQLPDDGAESSGQLRPSYDLGFKIPNQTTKFIVFMENEFWKVEID